MSYPVVPRPFDPLLEPWPADLDLWRCHNLLREGDEPNCNADAGRFRPIQSAAGAFVPTVYAGENEQVAIAESAFHDLPISAELKPLARALTDRLQLTPLVCARDLALVSLRGFGLQRLGQTQASLISPGPLAYAATTAWGQAAYDDPREPDGIIWTSRLFSAGASLLLFWDRCGEAISAGSPALPLALGPGYELLCDAANAAGVVVTEP